MINKYYKLGADVLFKINRSLTGKGIEKTLKIFKKFHPELKILYFKSGKKTYDWFIPDEWNIKNGFIKDKFNKKLLDFKKNNLHIMGYSTPIDIFLKKKQLLKKLFICKKDDNAIPYITSYYKKNWGFCISKKEKLSIIQKYNNQDKFHLKIDSSLKRNGRMPMAEYLIPGKSKQEILISTYVCHPSMANNELSGPLLSLMLIEYFKKKKNSKSLKFLFYPETIGSIAYIKKNKHNLSNIIGSFNLSCVGDERGFSCMLSRISKSPSDLALLEAFKKLKIKYKLHSFLERGSDERQYNWPGVDVYMTSFFRSKYGDYPEYHTSKDTFETVVTKRGLIGSYKVMRKAIQLLDKKKYPKVKVTCEPKMDKRGLYSYLSYEKSKIINQRKYIDILIYSDGIHSVEQIAKKVKVSPKLTKKILIKLKKLNLVDF